MKILVAIDSTPTAADVVSYVKRQPWPADTKIRLLTVFTDAFPAAASEKNDRYGARVIEKTMGHLHQMIEDASSELRAAGFSVEVALIHGIPHSTILDESDDWKADLIVMGERSERPSEEPVLGSVSRFVVEHAACSVEVVRRPKARSKDAEATQVVMIATDGSDCAMEAVCWVASKPWPKGTVVHVVSVVERGRDETPGIAEDAVARGRELLSTFGLETTGEVLYGYPRIQIINEAGRRGAGLIVVGSHGRHGQDRLSLGSLSEAVAKNAHCSVVVTRAGDHRLDPPQERFTAVGVSEEATTGRQSPN